MKKMNNLPYFIPDEELELNMALLMIILFYLAKTKNGKFTANNERLLLYMYLLKNPRILSEVLFRMDRGSLKISDVEYFSVESIAVNVDSLFDIGWIKKLLQLSANKKYLEITYYKTDGFFYTLTDHANDLVESLNGSYFNKAKDYAIAMQKIQSESTSKLNNVLNTLLQGNT